MQTKPNILFVVLSNELTYWVSDITSTLGYIMQSKNELREFLLSFDYTNDCEVRYIPHEKSKGITYAYLSDAQVGELTTVVGDAGTLLMWHYLTKVTTPKYDFFDDKAVGECLKWSWRKVQAARLALIKAGWVKKVVYTQPTTKAKFTVVYLGKEMCSLVLTPDEYTANQKVISKYRDALINHFQCKDWEEVVASKSQDDIAAALRGLT